MKEKSGMTVPVYLNHLGIICALGAGTDEVAANLFAGISPGMVNTDFWSPGRVLSVGEITSDLPDISHHEFKNRSRNNQVLAAALAQIRPEVDGLIRRHGANRVGIVLGTSTSGVHEAEKAFLAARDTRGLPDGFHYSQQEMGSAATFLANELGVSGPAWVISTACSSSARALASAARLLRSGLVDVVITGGVDTLCQFTIAGFSALESVGAPRCNPLSVNRCGINIGEAAVLFTMTRESGSVALLGWGESSDGHHMSAPDPEGRGAQRAITQALERAGLASHEIDYINLHGTATPLNDAMESRVVAQLFGEGVPVSSTKPLTGHTLGAAGALEAALVWLTLHPDNTQGQLPPHIWDNCPDPLLPQLKPVVVGQALGRRPRTALSSSFAFGGNNAVLVLGAA